MKDESRMSPEERDDYLNWCEAEKCTECFGIGYIRKSTTMVTSIGTYDVPGWIECPQCKGSGRA